MCQAPLEMLWGLWHCKNLFKVLYIYIQIYLESTMTQVKVYLRVVCLWEFLKMSLKAVWICFRGPNSYKSRIHCMTVATIQRLFHHAIKCTFWISLPTNGRILRAIVKVLHPWFPWYQHELSGCPNGCLTGCLDDGQSNSLVCWLIVLDVTDWINCSIIYSAVGPGTHMYSSIEWFIFKDDLNSRWLGETYANAFESNFLLLA